MKRVLFLLALAACSRDPEPEPAAARDASPAPAPSPTMEVTVVDLTEASAPKVAGWNAAKIDWQPFDRGMSRAKTEHRPVCLVVFTRWCVHCKAYSHVFEDDRVVERARDFVMIRVDADDDPAVNKKYAPDGTYIPRTLFLSSDGTVAADIHAARPRHKFFFDEADPSSLLGGMSSALQKLAKR